jgi:hypothetical protein
MTTARRLLFTAIGLALASTVSAGELRLEPKAVLELFTSQGCSSCPPADALFEELGKREDLVTLAYHVDYWDYIGWPDTFGDKANSDHQRAYAASWGSSRIYTPQLIVNGAEGVVASRPDEVNAALETASLPVPVALTIMPNDMLKVKIDPQPGRPEAVVWLITFIDRAEVAIDRGENEGQTIGYTQIVTGKQLLGMWEPGAEARWKLPLADLMKDGSNGVAILVQEEHDGLPGAILGAALLKN